MTIKFVDFCAGIGGFRIGLESLNWECVYSCEIDEKCEETYFLNFNTKFDKKDIFEVEPYMLPEFHVFCAGFPCQPFSIAGKRLGFQDSRGNIFSQIVNILKITQPPIVFLENVANLIRHDKGRTFISMKNSLDEIGYNVFTKILDSSYFGVPQKRPRVYILGFKKDIDCRDFHLTEKRTGETPLRNYLEPGDFSIPITNKWQEYIDLYLGRKTLDEMSFIVPKTRERLERSSKKADLNNCILQIRSSGIRAISIDEPMPTFAVSHSGGGAMIPVYTGERRHISITEIKRIMGFPDTFIFNVARTHAIKQLANSVCPPVISSIGQDIEKIFSINYISSLAV